MNDSDFANVKLIMVGGKGGVGKTTCSAALAFHFAQAGQKTLLIHLPQLFLNHLEAAARFYLNLYGAMERVANSVRLKKSKRTILEIIEGWKDLSQNVLDFIRDEKRTAYVIVTIAEALGVRLTDRLLKDFDAFHLGVDYLIVNHLVQVADCDFHRQRQAMQEGYLRGPRETYGRRMALVEVPLLPYEVKGIDRIQEVSEILFPGTCFIPAKPG